MRQIKLIASDLDGTLLRDDKSLSPHTRQVLARCREKGFLFFVATARPPRALERWISGLSYDGAICHNGGVVALNGEIIWEQGIPPIIAADMAQQILDKFPGTRLSAEIGGKLYANFDSGVLWPGSDFIPTNFSVFPDNPVEKLLVGLDNPGLANRLRDLLPPGLSLQISENTLAMIQPEGVEKGKALTAVCERLGVSPTETVAFGDDWNDISLLRAAGVGIAVENALPEVKAAAAAVCFSNEEDGPARWLEEHLLSGCHRAAR